MTVIITTATTKTIDISNETPIKKFIIFQIKTVSLIVSLFKLKLNLLEL